MFIINSKFQFSCLSEVSDRHIFLTCLSSMLPRCGRQVRWKRETTSLTFCKHSHQCVASIALVSPPRRSIALCAVLSCAQHAGFHLTSSHQHVSLAFIICLIARITFVILHWYTTSNECVIFTCFLWLFFLFFFLCTAEEEDQELISSFDSKLRNNFSIFLVLSMSVTGRQVLVEIEKMSSVERPIRSKQRGMNWTNRNTVSSWFPIANWIQSYQRINRNMHTHDEAGSVARKKSELYVIKFSLHASF